VSSRDANFDLELVPDAQAPGAARTAVSDLLANANGASAAVPALTSDNLLLLVSEVVTNAVLHSDQTAAAPMHIAARLDGESIRVTVINSGSGSPDDRKRHAGGYGLFLLDKLATRWGLEQSDEATARTTVWFELSLAA
jgi:anti-sigma regulatory factor (Ser/Thr protein kinase)